MNLINRELWNLLKREIASITRVPFNYEVMIMLSLLRMDLPDLQIINEGEGRLNNRIFQAIAEYAAITGKQFGATGTTSRMAYLLPELAIYKTGSIIAQPNNQGELVYYGPNVTMGYAFNKADLLRFLDIGLGWMKWRRF